MNNTIEFITKIGFKQYMKNNNLYVYTDYNLYIFSSGYFLQQYDITIKTFTREEDELLKQYLKQIIRKNKLKNIIH
jgi:hypothetical protein